MKPAQPHPLHHQLSGVAIGGICAGTIVFLISMTALVYKCYRRRVMMNAQNRLSTAIKKGLQESTSGSFRKSTPVRSTGKVMKSKATSPISPPSCGELGGLDRVPAAGFSTPSRECGHGKSEVYIEHEKGGATPEKEELLKEKYPSEKTTYLGSIEFSVEYDNSKQALVVSISNAANLPPRDPNLGGCDPYIKLQLLPEKKHKCKTRVLRKTLDPIYDETFTFFGIAANQFSGITLHFVVLSFDRFSRDDIIGEVIFPLSGMNPEEKQVNVIKEISPRHLKLRSQGRGELLVSLCYQPAANRLGVVVLKARNLPKMDITGLSDPYIKIYLLYNGQRIAKKKTHVKKRTLNPVFNESFLFDVPYNEGLQNISLEFLVLDWDRMTKNEVVGRLEIGAKNGPTEVSHWNEVMNCPRKQIAEWHKLKE